MNDFIDNLKQWKFLQDQISKFWVQNKALFFAIFFTGLHYVYKTYMACLYYVLICQHVDILTVFIASKELLS